MLKVKKPILVAIAGAIWLIAGANISRIGIKEYINFFTVSNALISAGIFVFFYGMIFRRMVKKHTNRIMGYSDDKVSAFKFFDFKGYIVMTFMMGLGIVLRVFKLAPLEFIAVFYTGLGLGLLLAGVMFIVAFIKIKYLNN